MTPRLLALAAALLLLALAAHRLGGERDSGPARPVRPAVDPEGLREPEAHALVAPALRESPRGMDDRADVPPDWARFVEPYDEEAETEDRDADELARVTGRLLDPEGEPFADVPLVLATLAGRFVLQRTDAGGRFRFAFAPGITARYELRAWPRGLAPERWYLTDVLPRSHTDLGDLPLRRTGALEVRVRDESGQPLVEGLRVVVAPASSPGQGGGRIDRESSEPDEGGAFRFQGLPAGEVRVRSYLLGAESSATPELVVRAGETLRVAVVHSGPAPGSRLTVRLLRGPFPWVPDPDEGLDLAKRIRLVDPRGVARLAVPDVLWGIHVTGFLFDGLPPGEPQRLEVRIPGYEDRSRDVLPGTTVDAELTGTGSLVVEVLDEETGRRPDTIALHDASGHRLETLPLADGSVRIEHLQPGLFPFHVESGADDCLPQGANLAPGEQGRLLVRMPRPLAVSGTVLRPDGLPASDVSVTATPVTWHAPDVWGVRPVVQSLLGRPPAARGQTDAAGRYELRVRPGTYDVEAREGALVRASATKTIASDSAVDLALPGIRTFHGRLLGLGSLDPTTWQVVLRRQGAARLAPGHEAPVLVDADGRFLLEGVGEGAYFLILRFPLGRDRVQELYATRIELTDSRLRHELDMSRFVPASVVLRVTRNGVPAAGARVSLQIRNGRNPDPWRGELDAEGSLSAPLVFPGDYVLSVHGPDPDEPWSAVRPEPLVLPPGDAVEATFDLVDHGFELQVLDRATGAPAAGARVVFFPSDPALDPFGAPEGQADADGRVQVALPYGSYFVCVPRADPRNPGPPARTAGVDVLWTEAGPRPATVRLPIVEGVDVESELLGTMCFGE